MSGFKFYQLYQMGEVSANDIYDYIDLWHNGDSEEELHEFLGMTESQYDFWLTQNTFE